MIAAVRLAALLGALALCLACLGTPPQGDPVAPVLVRGVVLDAAGQPVGRALVQLQVSDRSSEGDAVEGGEAPSAGNAAGRRFQRDYRAHGDGRFEIRLWPGDVFRETGGQPAAHVNFQLRASSDAVPSGRHSFRREVGGSRWAGDVPDVTLRAGP